MYWNVSKQTNRKNSTILTYGDVRFSHTWISLKYTLGFSKSQPWATQTLGLLRRARTWRTRCTSWIRSMWWKRKCNNKQEECWTQQNLNDGWCWCCHCFVCENVSKTPELLDWNILFLKAWNPEMITLHKLGNFIHTRDLTQSCPFDPSVLTIYPYTCSFVSKN